MQNGKERELWSSTGTDLSPISVSLSCPTGFLLQARTTETVKLGRVQPPACGLKKPAPVFPTASALQNFPWIAIHRFISNVAQLIIQWNLINYRDLFPGSPLHTHTHKKMRRRKQWKRAREETGRAAWKDFCYAQHTPTPTHIHACTHPHSPWKPWVLGGGWATGPEVLRLLRSESVMNVASRIHIRCNRPIDRHTAVYRSHIHTTAIAITIGSMFVCVLYLNRWTFFVISLPQVMQHRSVRFCMHVEKKIFLWA